MNADPPSLLVLLAREDRPALLAALDGLLRLPPERLPVAALAAAGQGRERLAVIAPPARLAAGLALARERLGADPERPRWAARRQGLFYAAGADPGKVAVLFPGQGSQYPGMLARLRRLVPRVGLWFDSLDQVYVQAGYAPPSALLAPTATGTAQPGLYELARGGPLGIIADLALFELVRDLGLGADCVVGHSNGEHAAVFAAGRAPLDDPRALAAGLLSVTRAAGRLPPPPQPERLLAIANLEPRRLAQLLRGRADCWLAMDNCPHQQVIGGTAAACAALAPVLREAKALVAALPFTRAYHTPLFADWRSLLADYYAGLPLAAGALPVLSCRDARPLPRAPAACRRAMARQWTAPVRFRRTVRDLHRDGFRTFVEVGPGNTLGAFVADTLRGLPHLAVSTAAPRAGELEQLQVLLAELHVQGLALAAARRGPLAGPLGLVPELVTALVPELVRAMVPELVPARPAVRPPAGLADLARDLQQDLIARVQAGHDRLRAALPPTLAALPAALPIRLATGASGVVYADPVMGPTAAAPPLPFLGNPSPLPAGGLRLRRSLTRRTDPWVDHHALGRASACTAAEAFPLPVLPFMVGLAFAAEAGTLIGGAVTELCAVRALHWLALDQGRLDLELDAQVGAAGIEVRLGAAGGPLAFSARVPAAAGAPVPPLSALAGRAPRRWTAARFYARYAFHGPAFQGLVEVRRVGPAGIAAELRATALPGLAPGPLVLDPALLDCAGQLVAFWLLEQGGCEPDFGLFPVSAERVLLQGPPPAPGAACRCRVLLRPAAPGLCCADLCFETPAGAPVATLLGFCLRRLELPPWLARTLFGGAPVRLPGDLAGVRETLLGQGRIWARMLAHLALTQPERLAFSRYGAAAEGADWLLRRLARGDPAALVPGAVPGVPCDA